MAAINIKITSVRLDQNRARQQLQADLNNVARQLRLNLQNLSLGGSGNASMNRVFQNMAANINGVNNGLATTSRNMQTVRARTDEVTQSSRGYLTNLSMIIKKFSDWMIVSTLFYQPIRMFRDGLTTLREIDTELVNIAKVTEMTDVQMQKLALSAAQVGQEFGRTAQEYLSAVTAFARAGLEDQSEAMAQQALLLANVGDMGVEDAYKTIISTVHGMNLEFEDSINIIDKLDVVDLPPYSVTNMLNSTISEELLYI